MQLTVKLTGHNVPPPFVDATGQKLPAAAVQAFLSAVAPGQKFRAGHSIPAGSKEPGGQKFPGGAVQGFGCAEPPSQYWP